MSWANPIVSSVMERVCAEVLMPETDAGTLTWQWTSDGALDTTRNGVRIVLGVDPEQGHCITLIRDGAYDVTDYGKGPYGDLHRAAESSVLAAQIRADFGLEPMGETARQLPGAAGTGGGEVIEAGFEFSNGLSLSLHVLAEGAQASVQPLILVELARLVPG